MVGQARSWVRQETHHTACPTHSPALERLMVETDAPYMAPTPYRGKRCDSRYVYRMAETIAEIKGWPGSLHGLPGRGR